MDTFRVTKMVLTIFPLVCAYPRFKEAIPNGDNVPHPCNASTTWEGVGHTNPAGGGKRNQFGLDFKAAGMLWTEELCRKDSDSDGRTNGEELGDPNCTWRPGVGQQAPTALGITNPGICEPRGSPNCDAYNKAFPGTSLDCQQANTRCTALDQKDIQKMNINFPMTSVPTEETTYHCMLVDFPAGDHHLVATTPSVDNVNIVHHMILWGCTFPEDIDMTEINKRKGMVYRCEMTPDRHCQQLLGTWTYGHQGDCFKGDAGFRIGRKGTRIAALQIHYNNPEELTGETDQSGMAIYYTTKLRAHDASMFVVGQEYLDIPPYSRGVTFEHTCPSQCTSEMFKEPIYITRAANHMHYLGVGQSITVYRNGSKVFDLSNDDEYHYDRPTFYHYNPPIKVMPGDEIVTKCNYTSNRNTSASYGAGTNDEMCYGFITYFPVQKFQNTICIAWKGIQRCKRKLDKFKGIYDGCNWRQFLSKSGLFLRELLSNETCGNYLHDGVCTEKCIAESRDFLANPCLQGDLGEWMFSRTPSAKSLFPILQECSRSNGVNSLNEVNKMSILLSFVVLQLIY
ncbi:dopamine beta-hydroxylase-like [Mya arenaria]|uniref:dopamine beta-hydroxylase-like n=1 Tax=Mya arenaria TaxID=6604 RepID=UPI0022E80F8F|nr:dopamine beta-hydroxylase-like [Mya arenaria]